MMRECADTRWLSARIKIKMLMRRPLICDYEKYVDSVQLY